MKNLCVLASALLIMLNGFCQQTDKALAARIGRVENSLAPGIVYGDSIPALNLLRQMAEYKIQGLSIAVIKHYKLDWAKAYGWADFSEKRPVTTNTRFQAASISKSLNSLALLKLVQQGKIDLEADINNYLQTWKFPYDSISKNKKITLANLLSHTAGISMSGFPGYARGDSIPSVVQILDGLKPANTKPVRSLFEPSKRFQYSGGGSTITQLMLMDVTGMKYDDYVEKEVLRPLGMTNSSYKQPPLANVKDLATAYNGGVEVKGKYHIYPEQAAAGLWTTPSDLAKYIIETQLAYEGKSSKILSREMMQKRLTPYIDSNVALGVFLLHKPGITYFNHNGGNEGFVCTSYGSLKGGNGVVIMVNGDNFNIITELVNSVARVYDWPEFYKPEFRTLHKVPVDSFSVYTGKYLLGKDTLTISTRGENLVIQQNNQPADGYKMNFFSRADFSVKEVPDAKITVLFSGGKAASLVINQGDMKIPAKKVD